MSNPRPFGFRREKEFGPGPRKPLDREAKIRIKFFARAFMRRVEVGKAYGPITAKTYQVLITLLYNFHNAKTGACFPSYEAIATAAGCARSTVAEAIKALEYVGVLSWVNRLIRIQVLERDASGKRCFSTRVIRTSNAYVFRDPQAAAPRPVSSKSENPTGTTNQDSFSYSAESIKADFGPDSLLGAALLRLRKLVPSSEEPQAV